MLVVGTAILRSKVKATVNENVKVVLPTSSSKAHRSNQK